MTATNVHYDQSPRIFEAFLDARMKYTCGLFLDETTSLNDAQEAKLRLIARVLRLRGGESVLDIGCGWGSLARYLAEDKGCDVTGVTPAPAQCAYVVEHTPADVVLGRFEDVDFGDRRFDAISLVGVIEAMPDHRAVLRKSARLLRPGGRLYLSASCYRSRGMFQEYSDRPGSRQVSDDIFGFGVLRPLSALLEAVEDTGMSLTGVYDLTSHYERTITAWRARVEANASVINALRPGFADQLIAYFDIANAGWGYTTKHYGLTALRGRAGETEIVR